MPSLADLSVLIIDGQATGPDPRRDHLLELGWAPFQANSPVDPDEIRPAASALRLPEGFVVPEAVRRVTGIPQAQQASALTREAAWRRLRRQARRVAQAGRLEACPAVIHFARFEDPFLRDLHAEFSPREPFPLQVVCTHAIARRLMPGLPRKGLRAVAGFLGHPLGTLRRSADHVRATAWIWRHLVERLGAEAGVVGLEDLRQWLERTRPNGRTVRVFPMAPVQWKGLPDSPGIYRMMGQDGRLLYVGKAMSLRKRVAGYFRPNSLQAEHILEMLTQAFALEANPTATALEAALLECDEIKRREPPYNIALKSGSRLLVYFSSDLMNTAAAADPTHPVGPIPAGRPADFIQAFGSGFASGWQQLDHALLGVPPAYAPDPGCRAEGLRRFLEKHRGLLQALSARRSIARLGIALQRERRSAPGEDPESADAPEPEAEGWNPERVVRAVEAAARHAALFIRRARWFTLLSDSVLGWPARGVAGDRRRVIVLQRGEIMESFERPAAEPLPPAAAGWLAGVRGYPGFDFPTYERLRVLTTEIRRLVHEGREVELRFGNKAVIKGSMWPRLLEWI